MNQISNLSGPVQEFAQYAKQNPRFFIKSLIPVVGNVFAVLRFPLFYPEALVTIPETEYRNKFYEMKATAAIQTVQMITFIALMVFFPHLISACPLLPIPGQPIGLLPLATFFQLFSIAGTVLQTKMDEGFYNSFKHYPEEYIQNACSRYVIPGESDQVKQRCLNSFNSNKATLFIIQA